jgi:hypothetical protein
MYAKRIMIDHNPTRMADLNFFGMYLSINQTISVVRIITAMIEKMAIVLC